MQLQKEGGKRKFPQLPSLGIMNQIMFYFPILVQVALQEGDSMVILTDIAYM